MICVDFNYFCFAATAHFIRDSPETLVHIFLQRREQVQNFELFAIFLYITLFIDFSILLPITA